MSTCNGMRVLRHCADTACPPACVSTDAPASAHTVRSGPPYRCGRLKNQKVTMPMKDSRHLTAGVVSSLLVVAGRAAGKGGGGITQRTL
jgi:hypothetical protein